MVGIPISLLFRVDFFFFAIVLRVQCIQSPESDFILQSDPSEKERNSRYGEKILDIESGPSPSIDTSLRKAQFAIQGMTCTGCTSGVKSAVETLVGVESVDVHFISNQAIVIYRPNDTNPTQLINAIEDSGYGATLYEDQELVTQRRQQARNIRKVEVEFQGCNQ